MRTRFKKACSKVLTGVKVIALLVNLYTCENILSFSGGGTRLLTPRGHLLFISAQDFT